MKILLDAGHNGKRNQGVNKSYYESVQMWKLHEYLKEALEKYEGVQVGVTRNDINVYMDVNDRGKMAKGYDIMLSLHTNAVSGSSKTKRVIVYKPISGKADALATELANAILNTMNLTKDKYWYCETKAQANSSGTDYYGVIRGAASVGVPCLLLEQSFHTNKEACNWLLKDDNLKELAEVEAKAIAKQYCLKKPTKDEFEPYRVRVTISNLNIRKGAGTNYASNGYIEPGVYTIVDESNGKGATKWGKLKSGAGWISLDYAKKV